MRRYGSASRGESNDMRSLRVGTRVGRIRDWLARQQSSRVGRFRSYVPALPRGSKNSGAATTAYFMLSMLPTALAAIAVFGQTGGDVNALANRMITRMHLTGDTAEHRQPDVRHDREQRARSDLRGRLRLLVLGDGDRPAVPRPLRASVARRDGAVERPGSLHRLVLRDLRAIGSHVRGDDYRLRVLAPRPFHPALALRYRWSSGCGRRASCSTRRCRRGDSCRARWSEPSFSAARSAPHRWMAPTLNQNANAFGPFGVVLAFIGLVLTVITISMVCAVFAPVWEEFRTAERLRLARRSWFLAPQASSGDRMQDSRRPRFGARRLTSGRRG